MVVTVAKQMSMLAVLQPQATCLLLQMLYIPNKQVQSRSLRCLKGMAEKVRSKTKFACKPHLGDHATTSPSSPLASRLHSQQGQAAGRGCYSVALARYQESVFSGVRSRHRDGLHQAMCPDSRTFFASSMQQVVFFAERFAVRLCQRTAPCGARRRRPGGVR